MLELDHIYCMDCIEGMKQIPDKSFDAVITDPPFGIGFKYKQKEDHDNPESYWRWMKPIYKEINRIIKPGGFIAIWQAQKNFPYFWKWFGNDIKIYISAKNFVQLRKIPINYGYEPIILKYSKGEKILSPKKPGRSIDFFVANTAKFVTEVNSWAGKHPCPRPIDQTEELIKNFVIEDGSVLDPFIGSGTTALACKMNKRHYLGFEIEPEYYSYAINRLNNHPGSLDKYVVEG
jgi:site-specific DNA-methyltransferase (adenine-specific)